MRNILKLREWNNYSELSKNFVSLKIIKNGIECVYEKFVILSQNWEFIYSYELIENSKLVFVKSIAYNLE